MLDSPGINLLVFFAVAVVIAWLVAPRFGLFHLLRSHRRDVERIRMEDALKHAFGHDNRGPTPTVSSLANTWRIKPAAALTLVERMQHAGLASVVDGRILLTENGRHYALEIIRAHRLWERYLADETGVDPAEWHVRAERREHALTREQADDLSRKLGNPRFDPHGDPIPTADGELPRAEAIPLRRLGIGGGARVVRVEDEPVVVYAQLLALGIYPGMELSVDAKTDERIIIEAEGRKLILAPIVGSNVSIERMSSQDVEASHEAHESLAVLRSGEAARVVRISPACRGLERRRLMDLGILPGTRVEHVRRGLSGGLTSYRVRGTQIALRDEQALMISVHQKEKTAL